MTEDEVQSGLTDAMNVSGWNWYHTHDSRRSRKGFPDVVAWHVARKRLAFIEVKGDGGRVTAEQKIVLAELEETVDGDDMVAVGIANPDTYDSWLAYIMGSKV